MKRIRQWLIKEGMFNPSSLKEAREIFKFPVELKNTKKSNSTWVKYHLQRIDKTYL